MGLCGIGLLGGLSGLLYAVTRSGEGHEAPEGQQASDAVDQETLDSRAFLAAEGLSGVALGMDVPALHRARPALRRHAPADGDGQRVYVESLAGRQVLYLFDGQTHRLARVQLAGAFSEAELLLAHLEQRKARFGVPAGVWDCPAGAEHPLATRRFVWNRGAASAMEIVHLRENQALATFYVASLATNADSLKRGVCTRTRPEDFAHFPGAEPDN